MGHNPLKTSVPKDRPLDFSISNAKASIIYSLLPSFLPSAVQNRLPRLGSAGHSSYTYASHFEIKEEARTFNNHGKTVPTSHEIVLRDAQSTPEPTEFESYSETPSGFEENNPSQAHSNRQSLGSEEVIDWKFANQGLNLLSLSVQESTAISQNSTYGNIAFARQLYLHGLTYLLRGMPRDLTLDEQLSIQSSLPRKLLTPQEFDTSSQLSAHSNASSTPSVLHKLLASIIVQLFMLFQFLLPYFKFLLRSAYEYERTHHISEKMLASSVDAADTIGKQSLAMTAALYGMGNGKVGKAVSEAAIWLIKGITGGIHEGVGEGLNIIGRKE